MEICEACRTSSLVEIVKAEYFYWQLGILSSFKMVYIYIDFKIFRFTSYRTFYYLILLLSRGRDRYISSRNGGVFIRPVKINAAILEILFLKNTR